MCLKYIQKRTIWFSGALKTSVTCAFEKNMMLQNPHGKERACLKTCGLQTLVVETNTHKCQRCFSSCNSVDTGEPLEALSLHTPQMEQVTHWPAEDKTIDITGKATQNLEVVWTFGWSTTCFSGLDPNKDVLSWGYSKSKMAATT